MNQITNQMKHIRVNIFKMTLKQFSPLIGASVTAISGWERGIGNPNQRHMMAIRRLAKDKDIPWDDRSFFEIIEPASTEE